MVTACAQEKRDRGERGAVATEFIFVLPFFLTAVMIGIELFQMATLRTELQGFASSTARQLAFGMSLGADPAEGNAALTEMETELKSNIDAECTATKVVDSASPYVAEVELSCPYPGAFFGLLETGGKRVITVSSRWPSLEHFLTPEQTAGPD